MPLLDAALAFAITMLAVATAVTTLTTILQKVPKWIRGYGEELLGERSVIFSQMMTDFVEKELTKITRKVLNVDQATADAECGALVDQIKQLHIDGNSLEHLSNADLLDKFQHTDLGKKLLAELGANTAPVMAEISRRYSSIEKQYTELFRTKAQIIGTCVAFALAFALNIDSINILGSYISNPGLSAAVAAKSDQALIEYQAQLKKLNAVDSPDSKILDQVHDKRKNLEEQLDRLNSGVFPFGWSYFPYGSNPPKPWSLSDPAVQEKCPLKAWRLWGGWFFGITLTGLLAGLGSPFWYDVVRNITQLTRGGSPSATPTPTPNAGH